MVCQFADGGAGDLRVHPAPIKTVERMREKLAEYGEAGFAWPLAANILDPVRLSVVCRFCAPFAFHARL